MPTTHTAIQDALDAAYDALRASQCNGVVGVWAGHLSATNLMVAGNAASENDGAAWMMGVFFTYSRAGSHAHYAADLLTSAGGRHRIPGREHLRDLGWRRWPPRQAAVWYRSVVPVLLLLLACGDELAEAGYPGEPLFALAGLVLYDAPDEIPEADLYVTVLWEKPEDEGYTYVPPLRVETTFPARYALSIYQPPSDAVLEDAPDGGRVGFGATVLYEDTDGDGELVPDVDTIAGGSDDVILLYTTTELGPPPDAPAPPGGEEPPVFEPGFHAVRFDGDCLEREAPLHAADAAEVDLRITLDGDYAPLHRCE